jgi:protein phosphatase
LPPEQPNRPQDKGGGIPVLVGASSERGPIHDVNEDAWASVAMRQGRVLVVADGMGGKSAGAQASRLAVSSIQAFLANASGPNVPTQIRGALEEAHERIRTQGDRVDALNRMGCTCAVAVITEDSVCIGHTGDTRIYRVFASGAVARLTRDMTLLQEKLDDRAVGEADSRQHPDARVLRGYLGQTGKLRLTVPRNPIPIEVGDRILVCTDGVTGHVEDDEIAELTLAHGPEEAARRIVELARSRGSRDDATLVLAELVTEERAAQKSPKGKRRPETAPDIEPPPAGPAPTRTESPSSAPPPWTPGAARRDQGARRRRTTWIALAAFVLMVAALAVAIDLWRERGAPASPTAPGIPAPLPPAVEPEAPEPGATPEAPPEAGAEERASAPADIAAARQGLMAPPGTADEDAGARALTLQDILATDTPTSRRMMSIFRGQLRSQVLSGPRPSPLIDPSQLPTPLPTLLSKPAARVEADPDLRIAADRERAELLHSHLATLVLLGDVAQLEELDSQLTFREGDPHIKRMLLQLLARDPGPILESWTELHLLYGR